MDGSPNFFLLIHGWTDRNSLIGEQDGRSSPLLGLNDSHDRDLKAFRV